MVNLFKSNGTNMNTNKIPNIFLKVAPTILNSMYTKVISNSVVSEFNSNVLTLMHLRS